MVRGDLAASDVGEFTPFIINATRKNWPVGKSFPGISLGAPFIQLLSVKVAHFMTRGVYFKSSLSALCFIPACR